MGAARFVGAVHPLAPPGYGPEHEYSVKKQFFVNSEQSKISTPKLPETN
jgi:hypothetical protein